MSTDRETASGAGRRGRFLWPAAGIFCLALAVRAVHLWQIRRAVFFDLKMGDSRTFDVWAHQIAAGDWLGDAVFYQAPLYPYLLGAVYALLGDGPVAVRACQAVLGASSCVLLALAARRLFSDAAGVAAGLILACYAPAIFSDGVIQKSTLALFLTCLLLWLLSAIMDRPQGRRRLWLALGMATGLLSMTRENALLFAPAILAWLLLEHRRLGVQRLLLGLLFCLGIGAVLLPVATRNWVVSDEFHLTTYNFGTNFYIGNNRDATGHYAPLRPGRGNVDDERRDAATLAERALGEKLTAAQVSAYWTRRALRDIASQPAHWLRLLGRKLAMTWNAVEIGDTEGQRSHAEWSAPLRWTGRWLHFGVLAPLAFFGAWLTRRHRPRLWLLHLMIGGYSISVAMFYVFARYRFPLVPLLVLFAAAGLTLAPRFWQTRSPRQIAAALAATLLVAVACNWPMAGLEEPEWLRFYNWGTALQGEGRQREAIPQLRHAVRLNPDNPYAHNNLAIALESQGLRAEAIDHLRQAIRADADFADAHKNLGSALAASGHKPEALRHLREAARLAPESPEPLNNAAWFLATDPDSSPGEREEAIRLAGRAVALAPDGEPTVLDTLAVAYAAAGRLDEALSAAERALAAARSKGDSRAIEEIGRRVELYRKQRSSQRQGR